MSKIDKDSLVDSLYSSLNKKYDTKAYKLTDEKSFVFVKNFCSTGCTPLDIAISNRVDGGIPYGRFTLLEGLSSSGKSLLLATALANNQKLGGISVWMDNEFSVDKLFLEAIGINLDELLYINYEFIEDMMSATESLIYEIREQYPNKRIMIGWDSIAGAKTFSQGKAGFEKDGYNTDKAIIMSQKLNKLIPIISKYDVALVATQQLRDNMNAMAFGDKYCVDPYTTEIEIEDERFVRQKITLSTFASTYLNLTDLETPKVVDIENLNIKILSVENGKKCYKPLTHFVVKPKVSEHYTDGKMKVSKGHTFIEDDTETRAEDHKDFNLVNEEMNVVDVTVEDTHSYLANGRLNHNTSASGGKAAEYFASVQVRMNRIGKIKNKDNLIVGAKNKSVVRKTRIGPPWREAEFEVYFDSGIDDKKSCLEILQKYKVIKTAGAYKKWGEPLDEVALETLEIDWSANFQLAQWRTWMENDKFRKAVSDKIAECSISKYKGYMENDEVVVELEESKIQDSEAELEIEE